MYPRDSSTFKGSGGASSPAITTNTYEYSVAGDGEAPMPGIATTTTAAAAAVRPSLARRQYQYAGGRSVTQLMQEQRSLAALSGGGTNAWNDDNDRSASPSMTLIISSNGNSGADANGDSGVRRLPLRALAAAAATPRGGGGRSTTTNPGRHMIQYRRIDVPSLNPRMYSIIHNTTPGAQAAQNRFCSLTGFPISPAAQHQQQHHHLSASGGVARCSPMFGSPNINTASRVGAAAPGLTPQQQQQPSSSPVAGLDINSGGGGDGVFPQSPRFTLTPSTYQQQQLRQFQHHQHHHHHHHRHQHHQHQRWQQQQREEAEVRAQVNFEAALMPTVTTAAAAAAPSLPVSGKALPHSSGASRREANVSGSGSGGGGGRRRPRRGGGRYKDAAAASANNSSSNGVTAAPAAAAVELCGTWRDQLCAAIARDTIERFSQWVGLLVEIIIPLVCISCIVILWAAFGDDGRIDTGGATDAGLSHYGGTAGRYHLSMCYSPTWSGEPNYIDGLRACTPLELGDNNSATDNSNLTFICDGLHEGPTEFNASGMCVVNNSALLWTYLQQVSDLCQVLPLDDIIAHLWLARKVGMERDSNVQLLVNAGFASHNRFSAIDTAGKIYFAPRANVPDSLIDFFNTSSKLFKYIYGGTFDTVSEARDLIASYDLGRTWALIDVRQLDAAGMDVSIGLNQTALPSFNAMVDSTYPGGYVQDRGDMYIISGYASLERLLFDYYLRSEHAALAPEILSGAVNGGGGATPGLSATLLDFTPYIDRGPWVPFNVGRVLTVAGTVIGFVIVLAFLYPVSQSARRLVVEKERRIRESMLIMGMKGYLLQISWFLQGFAFSFIVSLLITILLRATYMRRSDSYAILLVVLVFAFTTVPLAGLLSTFFEKSRMAALLVPLIYFAFSVPLFAMQSAPPVAVIVLSLLSPTAFAALLDIIFEAESTGGFSIATLRSKLHNPRGDIIMGVMGADFFLYLLLMLYFDAVLPKNIGTPKHPLFFIVDPIKWLRKKCSSNNRGGGGCCGGGKGDDTATSGPRASTASRSDNWEARRNARQARLRGGGGIAPYGDPPNYKSNTPAYGGDSNVDDDYYGYSSGDRSSGSSDDADYHSYEGHDGSNNPPNPNSNRNLNRNLNIISSSDYYDYGDEDYYQGNMSSSSSYYVNNNDSFFGSDFHGPGGNGNLAVVLPTTAIVVHARSGGGGANHAIPLDSEPECGNDPTGVFERESIPADARSVDIRGLRKQFTRGKKSFLAVNNLYWCMPDEGVSVLLGHNGAGKSTVLNMMTGMIEPDDGDCYICGVSVREQLNLARQRIGFCPQHNILWPDLTCRQHLEFFAKIKGLRGAVLETAIAKTLEEVDLLDKSEYLSRALSGGMKRKLSVAIAFVGGSPLIFLDEPTAGMDVAARRHTWELLLRMSRRRSVLLTTHFMDEADLLGDRIAIMSHGRLKCCGSSLFLKARLGLGYNITMAIQPLAAPSLRRLDGVVKGCVHGAESLSHSGVEVSYRLPAQELDAFPSLLSAIEEAGHDLGIRGYALSATTLEEVFLRVAADDERQQRRLRRLENGGGGGGGAPHNSDDDESASDSYTGGEDDYYNEYTSSSGGNSNRSNHTSHRRPSSGAKMLPTDSTNSRNANNTTATPSDGGGGGIPSLNPRGAPLDDDNDVTGSTTDDHDNDHDDASASSIIWNCEMAQGGCALASLQFSAMMRKRFYNTGRDRRMLCFQIICPVVCVVIAMLLNLVNMSNTEIIEFTYEAYEQGEPIVFDISNCQRYFNASKALDRNDAVLPAGRVGYDFSPSVVMHDLDALVDADLYNYAQDEWMRHGKFGRYSQIFCDSQIVAHAKRDVSNPIRIMYNTSSFHEVAVSLANMYNLILRGLQRQSAEIEAARTTATTTTTTTTTTPASGNSDSNSSPGPSTSGSSGSSSINGSSSSSSSSSNSNSSSSSSSSSPDYSDPLPSPPVPKLVARSELLPATVTEAAQQDAIKTILIGLIIMIPFTFLPSNCVSWIVKERECKSRHLQDISGLQFLIYWATNYLFDMAAYVVTLILVMIIFLIFQRTEYIGADTIGATTVLFVVFGLCSTATAYVIHFMFSEHASAQTIVMAIGFITGFLLVIIVFILNLMPNTRAASDTMRQVFRIVPTFCVGEGIINLAVLRQNQLERPTLTALSLDVVGWPCVYMAVEIPAFIILTLLIDHPYWRLLRQRRLYDRYGEPDPVSEEDSDVEDERQQVISRLVRQSQIGKESATVAADIDTHGNPMLVPILTSPTGTNAENRRRRTADDDDENGSHLPTTTKADDALSALEGGYSYPINTASTGNNDDDDDDDDDDGLVDDAVSVVLLKKQYPNGKVAIKNVTFGVVPGEVFGFLGTNGAGKTTTISILCHEFLPTSGQALVCGYDIVADRAEALKCIGYCPQFDGTLDLLTVEEHLSVFAGIRGIVASQHDEVVRQLMKLAGLTEYKSTLSGELSGGNRRKLSVALALIGAPQVVFLDEPSAGMDPVARRGLWTSIESISTQCSIVLTTHHLEEVEALADCVAIMVDGGLRCIGDKTHLKNKYGSGFECSIRIEDTSHYAAVVAFMAEEFPESVLNEYRGQRFVYALPKDIKLSAVFSTLQAHRASVGICDYTISQTSIEQVFMRISEEAEEAENIRGALTDRRREKERKVAAAQAKKQRKAALKKRRAAVKRITRESAKRDGGGGGGATGDSANMNKTTMTRTKKSRRNNSGVGVGVSSSEAGSPNRHRCPHDPRSHEDYDDDGSYADTQESSRYYNPSDDTDDYAVDDDNDDDGEDGGGGEASRQRTTTTTTPPHHHHSLQRLYVV